MAENNIPGTDHEDAAIDAALRDYLCSQLDAQLGRSAGHFYAHLRGAGGGGVAAPRRRTPGLSPGGGWAVGIVGGAIAASIAALWAGPSLRMYTPPGPAGGPVKSVAGAGGGQRSVAPGMDLQMEELTRCSQTRDGGTVVLNGRTAARRLIRKELKQTRWVDPRTGASLEKIEPRQDIMLIQLDTY